MKPLKLFPLISLLLLPIIKVSIAAAPRCKPVTRRFPFPNSGGTSSLQGGCYTLTAGVITLVSDWPAKLPESLSQFEQFSLGQILSSVVFQTQSCAGDLEEGFKLKWYFVKDGGTGDASLKSFLEGNQTSCGRRQSLVIPKPGEELRFPPEETQITIEVASGVKRGWSLAIFYNLELTQLPDKEGKLVTSVRVMTPSFNQQPVQLHSHWTSEITLNLTQPFPIDLDLDLQARNFAQFVNKKIRDYADHLVNTGVFQEIRKHFQEAVRQFVKRLQDIVLQSFVAVLSILSAILILGVATGVVGVETAGAIFGAVFFSFVLFFGLLVSKFQKEFKSL